jgi:class 3 adenylate cyclase
MMRRGHAIATAMPELPTGTLTFLFTDIEGSTRLWEHHPIEARAALARHDQLIELLVADHHGHVVRPRGEGDSRFAVFEVAADAVAAACAIQREFIAEVWPTPRPLRVRMAVHTGLAHLREGDYYGSDVNRCARLRAVAYGGQTLLSGSTAAQASASLPDGVILRGLGQHRLKDLGQPERVYQLVHPELQAEFPPLKSLSSLLNNLPMQVTSFVGRERELTEVGDLVHRTRLLNLVGAGGAGKTRLALHVAANLLDDFDDGVWFVELAPLADEPLVAQALASALSVREEPGRLLLESVLDEPRPRQAFIVLDNCEHLIRASARLVDTILRTCPHVRILTTSREALGVVGETTWRVPSLSLPDEHTRAPHAEILQRSEAVRLFQERAAAVQQPRHCREAHGRARRGA